MQDEIKGSVIKSEIIAAGLRCYEVADELKVTDTSFSRKLRNGVTLSEAETIRAIIDKLTNA